MKILFDVQREDFPGLLADLLQMKIDLYRRQLGSAENVLEMQKIYVKISRVKEHLIAVEREIEARRELNSSDPNIVRLGMLHKRGKTLTRKTIPTGVGMFNSYVARRKERGA